MKNDLYLNGVQPPFLDRSTYNHQIDWAKDQKDLYTSKIKHVAIGEIKDLGNGVIRHTASIRNYGNKAT